MTGKMVCLGLALSWTVFSAGAWAKSGSTVYTEARQANARANAQYDWAQADVHAAHAGIWTRRGAERVHELAYHPSLPRAKAPAGGATCPNGKPLLRWFVDPDTRPFQVKCMDTDPNSRDEWYPRNNFAAHYERNRTADGVYLYPATDTSYCNPDEPEHDCGYGAVVNGRRFFFVAYYVQEVVKRMVRLDLGDPLDGRNLMWSGALTYVFAGGPQGHAQGMEAGRAVAAGLTGLAARHQDAAEWYRVHLQREPGLGAFLEGSTGMMLGRMADGLAFLNMVRAYDIVYPIFDDPHLQDVLAAHYPGQGPDDIRAMIEELFWLAAEKLRSNVIWGNASLPHNLALHTAFVLDAGAPSQALIDWVFTPGQGRLPELFFDSIDRDGGSDEVAPGYNAIGYFMHLSTGELLDLFDEKAFDLDSKLEIRFAEWRRMKYRLARFFRFPRHLESIPGYYVHLGDGGMTGRRGLPPMPSVNQLTRAFDRFGPDQELAQLAREANGGTLDGLHTTIWDADPYAVQREMTRILRRAPAKPPIESALAGYGLAQLRGGATGTEHSVWGYFGRSNNPIASFGQHAHHNALDFGIQFAGHDLMPSIGYPSGFGWRYFAWEANTVSHNSIVVDRTMQSRRFWSSELQTYLNTPGSPVSMMTFRSRHAYPGVYEFPQAMPRATLHRSLIRVPLDGERFYVIEVSHVVGGDVHHYSYHGGGAEVTFSEATVTATGETYAALDSGEDVAFGEAYDFTPATDACRALQSCLERNAYLYRGSGFQFLADAAALSLPENGTWLEWNQRDWNGGGGGALPRLRARVMPIAGIDQLALATGFMPRGEPVRYLMVRGRNEGQGSAVATLWAPHRDGPHVETVRMADQGMGSTGPWFTLSVTLSDGRVHHIGFDHGGDTLREAGGLQWRGRLAVVAVDGGQRHFAYLGEGTRLTWQGESLFSNQVAAYTGSVDQVREDDGTSMVRVREGNIPTDLARRWIHFEAADPVVYHDQRDHSYRIRDVLSRGRNTDIDLGETPLISGHRDRSNYDAGFSYHVNEGDAFRIPMDSWR